MMCGTTLPFGICCLLTVPATFMPIEKLSFVILQILNMFDYFFTSVFTVEITLKVRSRCFDFPSECLCIRFAY